MLDIVKENVDGKLTIKLEGRLDTTTAPDLQSEIDSSLEGVNELVLDLEKLEYISSAGLRVLLSAQKKMNAQGSMTLINVGDAVKEIFEITGFIDILTIE